MRKDHTHTPEYRPSNVTITEREGGTGYTVLDFDGTPYANAHTYNDALALQRKRRGVIKAALTRRANKARAAERNAVDEAVVANINARVEAERVEATEVRGVRHLTHDGATALCRKHLGDAAHDAPVCDVCKATADHPRYVNTTHTSATMKALCVTCKGEEPVTITLTRATAGKLIPWVQFEKAPEARALHAAINKALA